MSWLLFIREEGDPLFVASGWFPSKLEGEGTYLADGDQFFLLGGREERTWGAYLARETNSSFWAEESGVYFPNAEPRRGLPILGSWQSMG